MGATKIRLPLLVLLLAAAALTVAAGLMLFSTFMYYDDEGYVLVSLRNFVEHGHLYGSVYTQYGPFPFVFYYLLHLLGLPLTHTAGRLITLVAWSGCATLTAWMTWRATRRTALMLAVLAAVFVYLWIMVSEPGHPGGLIAFTTAIMATFGCRWLAAGRWSAWAAMTGAASAVLMLTKVNIGGFAALSTLALLLLHARDDRVRRWAPWIPGGWRAVLPYLLMRPLLANSWVQIYAFVFALSAIAAMSAAARTSAAEFGARQWIAGLLGAFVTTAIVLGITFARGTTPAELLQGTILGPLRHPGHFSLAFHWPPGAGVVAVIVFALFVFARWRVRRLGADAADTLVATLRVIAAIGIAVMIFRFPAVSPDNVVFAFSAPCLWFFLWPLAGESAASVRAQTWLALLFLGQWLHVYPVPGSQIAWGTFLAIPLVAIGASNAARWFAQQTTASPARFRLAGRVVTTALLVMAVITGGRLARIGDRYLDSRSLELPGAETVRLPDSTTALFRLLVFNADAHSDMVFSLPGMFSLNVWSQLPTPTLANVTHWFSLLDVAQQEAAIQSLQAHPNACVIIQKDHVEYLRTHHLAPTGPLYDYIMQQFAPAFEIDAFQFCVRRGRSIAPLLTGELFRQAPAAAKSPADPYNCLANLTLLLPPDQQIGSLELVVMDDPQSPSLHLQASNCRIEVAPIDLTGAVRGPVKERTFPFALHGPALVSVYFNNGNRYFSTVQSMVVVRNPAGAELALVRLRP